jgi:hypothetical protein
MPEGTAVSPGAFHRAPLARNSIGRCEHRPGSLLMFQGPSGQDEMYGPGRSRGKRLIHEFRGSSRGIGLAVHSPSTKTCTTAGLRRSRMWYMPRGWRHARLASKPGQRASGQRDGRRFPPRQLNIRRGRRRRRARGVGANFLRESKKRPEEPPLPVPTHHSSCKHIERLADASTGGISGGSWPLWARRRIGRRPLGAEAHLSTTFDDPGLNWRWPSTLRPRTRTGSCSAARV